MTLLRARLSACMTLPDRSRGCGRREPPANSNGVGTASIGTIDVRAPFKHSTFKCGMLSLNKAELFNDYGLR